MAACLPDVTSIFQVARRKKGHEVSSNEALPFNSGREDPACPGLLAITQWQRIMAIFSFEGYWEITYTGFSPSK